MLRSGSWRKQPERGLRWSSIEHPGSPGDDRDLRASGCESLPDAIRQRTWYLTEKDEYGENQEYEKLSEESEDSEERSAWQKAVKIGTTNGSKDRVILGLEGRRYLNRPGMDEVERLRRELPPR